MEAANETKTVESRTVAIRKLTGDNYASWVYQIKLILMETDLWTIIVPGETKPEDTDIEGCRRYHSRQGKALAKICLSLGEEQQQHVRHLNSPKDVWEELERLYAPRDSRYRVIQLRRRLYSIKFTEHGKMDSYLAVINGIVTELANIGDKIEDADLAMVILCGLPDEWDTIVSSICNLPEQEFTCATVRRRLLAEYERKYASSTPRPGGAMFTKVLPPRPQHTEKQINAKEKAGIRNEMQCYHCGRKGHLIKDCRARLKEKSNTRPVKRTPPDKNRRTTDLLSVCGIHQAQISKQMWVIDSGATHHMSPLREYFTSIEPVNVKDITIANGTTLPTGGKGTLKAQLADPKGIINEFTAKDALLVPDIQSNVLSVSQMIKNGKKVVFRNDGCFIYNSEGSLLLQASERDHLYIFEASPVVPSQPSTAVACSVASSSTPTSLDLWHRRLAHVNKDTIVKMVREQATHGLECTETTTTDCDSCLRGKATRQPVAKVPSKGYEMPMDLVHSDLMGPIDVQSWGGFKYVLTIIDDATRFAHVYFLRRKGEALDKFKEWLEEAQRQTSRRLKRLRTDNGLEFCSKEWDDFCKSRGIIHETTMPYTPRQNGIAERFNRTLLDLVRSIIAESGLPKASWAELVNTATYVRNRVTNKHNSQRTPHELWYGKKPSVKHMRVVGCRAFLHIPRQKRRSKLDSRAQEGILLGYPKYGKGWRIWLPSTNKVVESCDCTFLENQMGYVPKSTELPYVIHTLENGDGIGTLCSNNDTGNTSSCSREDTPTYDLTQEPSNTENAREEVPRTTYPKTLLNESDRNANQRLQGHPMVLRPLASRQARSTSHLEHTQTAASTSDEQVQLHLAAVTLNEQNVPETFQEAISCDEANEWLLAMQREIEALKHFNVWDLVPIPDNVKPIGCRWVFAKRPATDGTKTKYKARLVAQGFSQRKGIDFEDSFSPVPSFDIIRLIVAVAVENNWKLEQFDVSSAYLHGDLPQEVYMEQPPGFQQPGQEKLYCRLKKALYGLKQSGRCWSEHLTTTLKNAGFIQDPLEPCVYRLETEKGSAILIAYVDDFLVASQNQELQEQVNEILEANFCCRRIGKVNYFLGVQFSHHEDGSISLSQEAYIDELLKKYGLENSRGAKTPLEVKLDLQPNREDNERNEHRPYVELIGALLYISQRTRPDISFAVSRLAQFNSCFGEQHWLSAKRVLKYLKETKQMKLTYRRTDQPLVAYADADWGGCTSTRRSTTGVAVILAGAPVVWGSNKQSIVTLSSMEAEYVALGSCVREVIWIRRFLTSCGQGKFVSKPTIIYSDSQAAIKHAENCISRGRTKHIDIRQHFIREKLRDNTVSLRYVTSEANLSDILTKSLGKTLHYQHLERILGM